MFILLYKHLKKSADWYKYTQTDYRNPRVHAPNVNERKMALEKIRVCVKGITSQRTTFCVSMLSNILQLHYFTHVYTCICTQNNINNIAGLLSDTDNICNPVHLYNNYYYVHVYTCTITTHWQLMTTLPVSNSLSPVPICLFLPPAVHEFSSVPLPHSFSPPLPLRAVHLSSLLPSSTYYAEIKHNTTLITTEHY